MLKLLFLFSIAITIVLTALQISGIQTLELIIIMVIINFLSLGAYLETENRNSNKETRGLITTKLEGIEKVCNDILTHVVSPNPGFEAKLEKQKDDMSYILDKIAKKSLELEEKLNTFGHALVNKTDDKKNEESEEVKVEEKPESFSVGEIVYMDEEEKE